MEYTDIVYAKRPKPYYFLHCETERTKGSKEKQQGMTSKKINIPYEQIYQDFHTVRPLEARCFYSGPFLKAIIHAQIAFRLPDVNASRTTTVEPTQ